MAIDYTSPIGYVRITIGDLDESNFKLTDEQIQGFIDMTGNVVFASIYACRALMGIYASTSGDEYKVDTLEYKEGKSKVNQLQAMLKSLEDSIKNGTNPMMCGVPFTTGIFVDELNENMERINAGEIIGPQIKDGEYDIVEFDNQDGPYQG